ncbi:MAG: hypothetical protein IJQ53_05760 [Clostridia bacterium]|nr:hypothetical protein [Clostridia bacterium]MBR6922123.1 hypothetical protein [Clostridia bacterium]
MAKELDHNKKYVIIDGHMIELSFSKNRNNELFPKIKGILLGNSEICDKKESEVKYKKYNDRGAR